MSDGTEIRGYSQYIISHKSVCLLPKDFQDNWRLSLFQSQHMECHFVKKGGYIVAIGTFVEGGKCSSLAS